MQAQYYISENGRMIKFEFNQETPESSLLSVCSETPNIQQWISIQWNDISPKKEKLRKEYSDKETFEVVQKKPSKLDEKLKISEQFIFKDFNQVDFYGLKSVSYNTKTNSLFFSFDKTPFIHCYPLTQLINKTNQTISDEQAINIVQDQEQICDMMQKAQKKHFFLLHNAEMPVNKYEIKQSKDLKPLEKNNRIKINDMNTLKQFAMREISRLNHWYVWNGRKKAKLVQNALDTLDNNWSTQSYARDYVISARRSGLVDALSMHRYTFFTKHNPEKKPTSYEDFMDKFPLNRSEF